jgi:hypothetical protein
VITAKNQRAATTCIKCDTAKDGEEKCGYKPTALDPSLSVETCANSALGCYTTIYACKIINYSLMKKEKLNINCYLQWIRCKRKFPDGIRKEDA